MYLGRAPIISISGPHPAPRKELFGLHCAREDSGILIFKEGQSRVKSYIHLSGDQRTLTENNDEFIFPAKTSLMMSDGMKLQFKKTNFLNSI